MKGFQRATHQQENVTVASGLGNIVTLTSEVPRQTSACVLCRLGQIPETQAGPEMSRMPRSYRSREKSGRTLGETTASSALMQRQKGSKRSCCVLQERDGSLSGGRQWGSSCHWLQYVSISLGIVNFAMPYSFRMSTLTEVTFRH